MSKMNAQETVPVENYVTLEDIQKIKNGTTASRLSDSSYTDSLEPSPIDGKPQIKVRRKRKSRLPVPKDSHGAMPKKTETKDPLDPPHTPDSMDNDKIVGDLEDTNGAAAVQDPDSCSDNGGVRDELCEKKCQRSQSTEEYGSKDSSRSNLSRRETIDLGETKHRCAGKPLKESKMDMFMNSNECFLIPNPPTSLSHKDTITSRMRIEKAHNEHMEPDKSPSDYLTPFQRKEQAIKDLKREMKKLNKALEERDAEISQLREGLGKEAQELLSVKDCKIADVQKQLDDTEEKYDELKRSYEESVKTVTNLEATITDLKESIAETQQKHESLYLEMYVKGQNAARYEREEEIEQMAGKVNNKLFKKTNAQAEVNLKELLAKLNRTQEELAKWQSLRREEAYQEPDKPETEAEATLRFLRDSFFHYMTDGKGQDDHMRAMIQIFKFTDVQKKKISKSLMDRKSKA